MGSGSAAIGTPVVCQVHELDQQVGPNVARRPTSVLIHNEGLGPKRAVPAVLQTIRPPSLAAYGADISANANTTNHPTMTRAVTAPAITFSFSFVV